MTADRPRIELAVRRLLRRSRSGMLATLLAEDGEKSAGHPYASLATVAWDTDLSPLFLFSGLSDHTKNLNRDPRAALLVEEASRRANPQTGPRLTVVGTVAPCGDGADGQRARRRFLARHPGAALYADFPDFRFFRMKVERIHYVGGFGRAVWVEGRRVAHPDAAVAAIAAAEPGVLDHMNRDHADTLDRYARRMLGRQGRGWRAVGLDPDGLDLARKAQFARLDFDEPAATAGDVRARLVALADAAKTPRAKRRKTKA
ncbi:MAG: DUF2470 domain-containing protein [Alphaproteobacteria bacterium]|nr:DUF2470 domain-containing protein [Alphaproteobacteria bacterium]